MACPDPCWQLLASLGESWLLIHNCGPTGRRIDENSRRGALEPSTLIIPGEENGEMTSSEVLIAMGSDDGPSLLDRRDDDEPVENLALNPDELLSPLARLQKYVQSEIIFNRQVVARSLLETLRSVAGSPDDVDAVFTVIAQLSDDAEPSVRAELMDQVAPIASYCREENGHCRLTSIVPVYLVPIIIRYITDVNNQVRKAAQTALLVMLEQQLVERGQLERDICPLVLQLTETDNMDDHRTEAIVLISKMAPLVGQEITKKLFLSRFTCLCQDSSFHVRKVCASHFGEFCAVVGQEATKQFLLPQFYLLCEDNVWGVRKSCAEVFMPVSCVCSMEVRRVDLAPLFVHLLCDQSRWVKIAAFQALGPFISTFADPAHTGLCCDQDGLLIMDENLVQDKTALSEQKQGPTQTLSSSCRISKPETHEESMFFNPELSVISNDGVSYLSREKVTVIPSESVTIIPSQSVTVVRNDDVPNEEVTIISSNCMPVCSDETTIDQNQGVTIVPNASVTIIPNEDVTLVQSENVTVLNNKGVTVVSNESVTVVPSETVTIVPQEVVTIVQNEDVTFIKNEEVTVTECTETSSETVTELKSYDTMDMGEDNFIDKVEDSLSVEEQRAMHYAVNVAAQQQHQQDISSHAAQQRTSRERSSSFVVHSSGEGHIHVHMDNETAYNAFQYWRTPLPELELDIDIGSSNQASVYVRARMPDAQSGQVYASNMSFKLTHNNNNNNNDYLRLQPEIGSMVAGMKNVQLKEKNDQMQASGGRSSQMHVESSRLTSVLDPQMAMVQRLDSSYDQACLTFVDGELTSMRKQHSILYDYDQFLPNPLSNASNNNNNFHCGNGKIRFSPSEQNIVPAELLEQYLSMTDSTRAHMIDTEIARYCAYSFPAVALTLGRKHWPCLRHTFEILASDLQWKVRRTLAASMHELAVILGCDLASQDLLPVFAGFLGDLDEVRIGILQHLALFLKLLRPSERREFLPQVTRFLKIDNERNWRFRLALTEQLMEMVEIYSPSDVRQFLVPLSLSLVRDRVCQVRQNALKVLAILLRRVGQSSEPGLLKELLGELAEQLTHAPKWSNRQTFAFLCELVMQERSLSAEQFARDLLPHLLYLGWDKVPNVRMAVARCLALKLFPHEYFSSTSNPHHELLVEALQMLQKDSDRDVRYFASLACETSTTETSPVDLEPSDKEEEINESANSHDLFSTSVEETSDTIEEANTAEVSTIEDSEDDILRSQESS